MYIADLELKLKTSVVDTEGQYILINAPVQGSEYFLDFLMHQIGSNNNVYFSVT